MVSFLLVEVNRPAVTQQGSVLMQEGTKTQGGTHEETTRLRTILSVRVALADFVNGTLRVEHRLLEQHS